MSVPLQKRAGYREVSAPADDLQRELNALARKHGLLGCVLVQFGCDSRMGVRSCGFTDEFCRHMDALATRILTDIDDGRHDPLEFMQAEGRA